LKKLYYLPLFFLILGCSYNNPPTNTLDVCKIFKEKYSWYKAAKNSEERWKIPIHVSLAIIKQESSFISDARPERTKLLGFIPWKRTSSARGYAQALDGTWSEYLEERGGWFKQRNDFEDAVDFIGWYNYKSHKKLGISMTNARALYLAYHEGWNGYKKGSYRKKPWLMSVADKVQRQSDSYKIQYESCKKQLGKRFRFF
tara:strand:+ start:44423 stop:45022 length:600 start_codon:yes stop_codon:yes gene_type:complete